MFCAASVEKFSKLKGWDQWARPGRTVRSSTKLSSGLRWRWSLDGSQLHQRVSRSSSGRAEELMTCRAAPDSCRSLQVFPLNNAAGPLWRAWFMADSSTLWWMHELHFYYGCEQLFLLLIILQIILQINRSIWSITSQTFLSLKVQWVL